MANLPSGQLEAPPYPSDKELRYEDIRYHFSSAVERLFWPFEGVFPAGISVMKTRRGASDDLEPFFQPDTGTWHEIAQLPVTEPKVSSLEIAIDDLDQWEYDWVACHEWHDREQCAEWVTYGDLSDEDRPYATEQKEDGSWEEDSDTEFLIRCCGEDRPLRKRGIKLVVTPSAGSDHFVTVRDYVSAVHAWLMSLREDIMKAKTVATPEYYPDPAAVEWMVHKAPTMRHEIQEKKEWVSWHSPPPPTCMTASMAGLHAKIRASLNR